MTDQNMKQEPLAPRLKPDAPLVEPEEAPPDIMGLLAVAVRGGANIETVERLTDLYHRIEDRRAAKQFTEAMAQFHATVPSLKKARRASFATRSGGTFSYNYADLPEVCSVVNPLLHPLGLSYRWDSETSQDGARVKVTCTLSHVAGHSVTASYEGPVDKGTGTSGAQDVQKVRTYGERQSLIQVLGVFTADEDTDAAPAEPITDGHLADLEDLLRPLGPGRRERFLKTMGVERLGDLAESNYTPAKNLLRAAVKGADQ